MSSDIPITTSYPPSLGILDLFLSLPSVKILEAGDFRLGELTKRLKEALVDESQWTEILQLTGDMATLLIECLDKVNDVLSRSRHRILTVV